MKEEGPLLPHKGGVENYAKNVQLVLAERPGVGGCSVKEENERRGLFGGRQGREAKCLSPIPCPTPPRDWTSPIKPSIKIKTIHLFPLLVCCRIEKLQIDPVN